MKIERDWGSIVKQAVLDRSVELSFYLFNRGCWSKIVSQGSFVFGRNIQVLCFFKEEYDFRLNVVEFEGSNSWRLLVYCIFGNGIVRFFLKGDLRSIFYVCCYKKYFVIFFFKIYRVLLSLDIVLGIYFIYFQQSYETGNIFILQMSKVCFSLCFF